MRNFLRQSDLGQPLIVLSSRELLVWIGDEVEANKHPKDKAVVEADKTKAQSGLRGGDGVGRKADDEPTNNSDDYTDWNHD